MMVVLGQDGGDDTTHVIGINPYLQWIKDFFVRYIFNYSLTFKSDSLSGSKELMWSGSEFTFPRCKDDNYPQSSSFSSFIDHLFSIYHVL